MPNSYDAVTRHLIDLHPADWLALLGIVGADAETFDVAVLDTDLSTVTSQADRVLKINGPTPSLQHVELETGHHGFDSPKKLLRYSVLVSSKYNLPVESFIVLLRREADSPALTGILDFRRRSGEVYLSFEYTVIRVWELPVDDLLAGGIGTLPLAVLADVSADQIPNVIRLMQERLSVELQTDAEEGEFWTAANILLGLRFPEAEASEFLKGVRRMKESVTYQAIVEEGRVEGRLEGRVEGRVQGRAEEARRMLVLVCEGRLGAPSAAAMDALTSIDSVDRLEALARRLFAVESWDDLLTES